MKDRPLFGKDSRGDWCLGLSSPRGCGTCGCRAVLSSPEPEMGAPEIGSVSSEEMD